MKNKIEDKLHEIASYIYENNENNDYSFFMGGLYNGKFGELLFLYYYSRFSMNDKYETLTNHLVENLITELGKNIFSHTYCGGLSGILYLFEYLKKEEFIDIDISDAQNILDEYLIKEVRTDIKNKNYDFLHGGLGVGLYFLSKGENLYIINELIDFIDNTAEIDEVSQGLKWLSVLNEEGDMGYNIALSHGSTSITLFLCKVIEKGVENNKSLRLLKGGIKYLLAQKIDLFEYGSFFPNFSIESSPSIFGSRLAWCYGDLGIAYGIWYTGKISNNKNLEYEGLDILRQSTKRKIDVSGVVDGCVCHGSAGLVMIYRRMYFETKDDLFLDAACYWLEKTLELSKYKDGVAGYKTYEVNKWKNDYSLLTGVSGIGLVLLDYISDNSQNWDKMFLL
ncbi:lanthionine synthetase C family protein [Dysgonomonas sp. Marseille-P4677]|uniref:lanthionine synthetase C family protein n=1 Tax=Dysgonomonas sp. Marseille-P4677 TaxID=2364790 RepID=UPI001914D543|nr:lanthionine synthetase C family protein [Dysgonomonas sp. Marseille-P4677]MBK5722833.1 lanthionine synthetase C family protein [Dysgonomonas sp. Marseille-P4677]